ncbi:hypothetical protein HZY83_07925 [Gemella sp. GH3]|uniref:two-component system activity regulator YycH n=1 Tax=unclassified Gemella TaxID=2624949 RepID=UPI0015D018AC|nr:MULTISPECIES: two-component system activity regulator YycH [unclassified Gemella]MBF0714597.1 hypothetical protein [Gemella sp. GH3.1]NYS51549.1 hypothetical protein [Gemella sp. GH3]
MEKRKETIKTFILLFLVVSSIFLTLSIVGNKSDYELLGLTNSKQEEQAKEKLKTNSLNLLSPNIIVKENKENREEPPMENAIIKASSVHGVKDKHIIKDIMRQISESEIVATRIRTKSINDILDKSKVYYSLNYNYLADTISSQFIYSGDYNQSNSLSFDTVIIPDNTKNIIYLYKSNSDTYMQIEFNTDIYNYVESWFNVKSEIYSKYIVDGKRKIYVKEIISNYYKDEYSAKNVEINNVAQNIFSNSNNIKISNLDSNTKEATDGYSILREKATEITYINPSNIIRTSNNNSQDEVEIQSISANFLLTGYVPDLDYTPTSIKNNKIEYSEVYQEGLVFSNDIISNISVQVNKEGVYTVSYPKIIRDTQISSTKMNVFSVENIDAVLNYLFNNVDLSLVEDVDLGYDKKYDKTNNKLIYTPTWYIKYNGKYIQLEDINEKVKKGEL